MNKKQLPLTFQFSKKKKIEAGKMRDLISIKQTKGKIKRTENFYKPISKIIVINDRS
ncbi:hypothetical protein IZU89_08605 [Cellulophaga lytica]|uniref:hypothetical protein n=1 Tax=Cellulophaga lytica TaxID=979 RepID=UPI0032E38CC4